MTHDAHRDDQPELGAPGRSRDPVGRAFRILRWMVESTTTAPVGVREIARALGMDPSTVSRALRGLEAEGIVRQGGSGAYSVGLELLRIGQRALAKVSLYDIARPHVERVAYQFNEGVTLGVYDESRRQMFRVYTVPSRKPLRYVIELNQWTEIYRGASGLAILAHLPPAERSEILNQADAERTADEPWLRRSALERDLAVIRRQGYACTHSRRIPGAVGVAAPIFDDRTRVIGDVIATVPEERFTPGMEEHLAKQIMQVAVAITVETGGRAASAEP